MLMQSSQFELGLMMTQMEWAPLAISYTLDWLYQNRDFLVSNWPETAEMGAREDWGGVGALGLFLQADHSQVGHLDRHCVLRVPLLARAAALHAMHA